MKKRAITAARILAGLMILVGGGYLIWCDTLEDNVIWQPYVVNGVSLEGMTKKEALAAVAEQFEDDYGMAAVTIEIAEEKYKAEIFPVLGLDASEVIEEAYELGHGKWYTRGLDWYERYKMGEEKTSLELLPTVAHPEKLEAILSDTGIEEVNTLVESTCELKELSLVIHKGAEGVSPDMEKLREAVLEALENQEYEAELSCPVITLTPEKVSLTPYYDQIYQKSENAYVDEKNNYAVVPSVDEISFDVKEAEKQVEEAKDGETLEIAFTVTPPELTTEELQAMLFRDVLGSYTTSVGGTSGRLTNVSLAAAACDDVVLMPGETFSYNETVGERTTQRGYQTAIVYENGQSVQGIGGGICQVSSTMFAACLYADLEIVQRVNHSRTVAYLPLGMDATVSWGGPDYQFKNNTDYPLKLSVKYEGGQLTVEIFGTKEDDTSVEILTQSSGGSVHTIRNRYDGAGNLTASEEVAVSTYR